MILNVGLNPVQKLPTNKFLKNRKYTMVRSTKQTNRNFSMNLG